MMTKKEVLEFVSSLQGATYDYPFEDLDAPVFRHRATRKWFGFIIHAPESYFKRYGCPRSGGAEVIVLKCPPDLREFLTLKFKGVLPGYHMNKKHWISVVPDSDVTDVDLKQLITVSYEITKDKARSTSV